ncbi:MAG TPA: methyltransferase domain-containing protein [Thermoanaerobaculia bacterium]|nr:methyltransferase domain-containing protein [Thermoanaerobaculia bacterium]
MSVLDVGCGRGDVSLLLAELVGNSGQVIGMDRDDQALEAAAVRAQQLGRSNLIFLQADLAGPIPDLGALDAVVGRRVLMYLKDPIRSIQLVTRSLRSGGVVVFQESDSTMAPGRLASLPLHDRVNSWIWETVAREGGNTRIGFSLAAILTEAGLLVEDVRAEATVQGYGDQHPMATIVRFMKQRTIEQGVATEAQMDVETLDQRLREELSPTAIYVSDMAFGIVGRKV